MTKANLSRRGLFGLGLGGVAAAVLPDAPVKAGVLEVGATFADQGALATMAMHPSVEGQMLMANNLADLLRGNMGAHKDNLTIPEIVDVMAKAFPDKPFAYVNVRQHMMRAGYLDPPPILAASPPVKPLTVEEWQWGYDGYLSWSRPDLDLAGALYLTRPARMGAITYGFYVMVPGNERSVPVWQAMTRGQMSFEAARDAALIYLGAFKDGLPPGVAETLRQRNETERSRLKRLSRDRGTALRIAAQGTAKGAAYA